MNVITMGSQILIPFYVVSAGAITARYYGDWLWSPAPREDGPSENIQLIVIGTLMAAPKILLAGTLLAIANPTYVLPMWGAGAIMSLVAVIAHRNAEHLNVLAATARYGVTYWRERQRATRHNREVMAQATIYANELFQATPRDWSEMHHGIDQVLRALEQLLEHKTNVQDDITATERDLSRHRVKANDISQRSIGWLARTQRDLSEFQMELSGIEELIADTLVFLDTQGSDIRRTKRNPESRPEVLQEFFEQAALLRAACTSPQA